MAFNNDNLSKILREWGEKQQRSPENNENLKIQAVNSLKQPEEKITSQRPFRFRWIVFACTAAVLTIYFVGAFYNQLPIPSNSILTTPGVQYPQSSSGVGGDPNELGVSYGEATGLGEKNSAFNKVARRLTGYFGSTPASDTREFLKTDYHANIKTRKVGVMANRIQTFVRGFDGRVDTLSVDSRHAYITFVVPKDSFENFKEEIKSLVPDRFISEEDRSQNLLPQKKSIEQQTNSVSQILDGLQKDRAALINRHNTAIISLRRQLNGIFSEIKKLQLEITTDTIRQQQINSLIAYLQSQQRRVNQNISNENSRYNSELSSLDYKIKNSESQLKNLAAQDDMLAKTVETIEGSVSIEWISLFEILKLYVPTGWLVTIFGAIILLYILFGRRKQIDLP